MPGLQLRTSGRAKKPASAIFDRVLTEEDLALLQEERGIAPPALGALRERHHALARLLAEGRSEAEASLITRYSLSRISILKADPAFQELIHHYREAVVEQFVDFQAKLAELGVDAAHILQERMEDPEAAKEITNNLLLQLVTVSADRTGHGPTAKTEVNLKVGLADRLLEARERIAARSAPAMVEGRARDVTPRPSAGDEEDE